MKQQVKLLMSLLMVLSAALEVKAETPPRERFLLDFGWEFSLGHLCDIEKDFGYQENRSKAPDGSGPASSDFKAEGWRKVDLPHDWAVALDVDKNADELHAFKKIGTGYPENSVGWYRKSFEIPKSDSGKRLTIEFDGVFRDCEVWLNGYSLWRHLSGYTGFGVDITDYANYGGENTLVVRVNASGCELWSYEGAGIYRHVWLVKTEPAHIVQWGTQVISEVKKKGRKTAAELTILTTITNQSEKDKKLEIISTILDANGKKVNEVKSREKISSWATKDIRHKAMVKNPNLWSVDSPYLHKLLTTVKEGRRVVDNYETTFGIRTIGFDGNKGFFLNGKRVFLKGVCLHQDHGGVGVAVPDRIQEFRIEKMKEMGAKALRTAHNWVAPEMLDAADRLGMLVINETRAPGSTRERTEQLCTMIKRDRNHPSVILWSLANEEKMLQSGDLGVRVMNAMKRVVRELDPTRPVTMAMTNDGVGSEVTGVLDVQGCNYIKPQTENFHKQFPDKPFILTESCCASTARGVYEQDDAGRLTSYDENAACWGNTAEKMWTWCVEHPWVAGTFVWTGFDYSGEPLVWDDECNRLKKEEVWPILCSQWGIVDRCGFEKDTFYYYKSWWSDDTVLHIFPHWNWQAKEGEEIRVWVYSNCEEVELIVNGQSLGRSRMPRNSHLQWNVKYEPGCIEARGYNAGKLVASDREETTGKPVKINLKPDRLKIRADNHDVSQVTVEILDEKGRPVPTADNQITLRIGDNGKIIGVCNGDPACLIPENRTTYPVFNGLMMVYVQSGLKPGPIKLRAEAADLNKHEVIIEAQPCELSPFIP